MQEDSLRFIFRGDFGTSYNDNNGRYLLQIGTNATSQIKSKDLNSTLFIIADYSLIRAEEQDFENSLFLHVRYNQRLSKRFGIESFAQSQRNKILEVISRHLVGGGVRWNVMTGRLANLNIGMAYMYEAERIEEVEGRFKNHRFSSYLSLNWSIPNSNAQLISTTYYQPLVTDFGDHQFLEQLKLDVGINEHISIFAAFQYFRDSMTPKGNNQYSSSTLFGIGILL